jgi:hypothetical protein
LSKVQVDTIDTRSGTSTMQIGSTNTSTINIGVSGDTVNIPAGVTIANAGTATGFGGDNTPMFAVSKSSSQNIGQNTTTKITFDNEYIDTDNAFASNKFTCPSGGAGNYSMTMSILFHKLNTTYLKGIEIAAYKNGAPINYGNDLGEANVGFIADTSYFTQVQGITTFIVTLAETDYVECYGKAIPANGNDTQVYNYYTHWTGHKLIT